MSGEKKEREATLRDLIGFIKEETDLVNDPLFSISAIDQYINISSVSLEKALGVYLQTENNIFRFKIVLKDKPMTRMGTLSIISSIFDPLGLAAPRTLRGKTILQLFAKMKLVGMELHLITSLENSSFGVKPCTV